MKKIALILILSLSVYSLAQRPVSAASDNNLNALINKVEGKDIKTSLVNDFKTEDESQQKASKVAQGYFQAFLDKNITDAYELTTPAYREVKSISKYLAQDRITFTSVHITDIEFKEGLCARVRGSYMGEADAQIGTIKLPIRLFLVKENGEWYVHQNPYNSMGIQLPQAKKFKLPCEF